MPNDLYDTLGVSRGASDKEIQSAYRRLARRYHPDVTGGDAAAEDKFKAINTAHDVLSDKEKRAAYDKWGDRWEQAEQLDEMERSGAFGQQSSPGGVRFEFGGSRADFSELGADDLSNLFSGLFSGRTAAPAHGRDLEHPITVSLREAFSGTTRTIQGPRADGGADGPRFSRLEVKIPPGVASGSRVKVSGQGAVGRPGGQAGDLFLLITVEDDPRFERKGGDLYTDAAIPVTIAALGGEVAVPTITGRVALRIPQGTQNGRVFRLAGQGMPKMRGGQRGDLFARARLQLPEPLSSEQLALFRQLRDLEAADGENG